MRRRFGLSVAMIVSLDGCVDDPAFQQVDAGDAGGVVEPSEAGTTSSSSSSSSGSTSSSSSSSGTPEARCKASSCAFAGGTCNGDTCVVTCTGNGLACGTEIRCPAGADCKVTCNGKNACKKVTCNGATSCNVTCSGEQACGDTIDLNSPATTLTCTGKDACKKAQCEGASCAVTCDPPACDAKDVKCCASSCTVNGAKGECK